MSRSANTKMRLAENLSQQIVLEAKNQAHAHWGNTEKWLETKKQLFEVQRGREQVTGVDRQLFEVQRGSYSSWPTAASGCQVLHDMG